MTSEPVAGTARPATVERETDGLEYHRIYRGGRQGWGWYLGGVLTMLFLFLVVATVLVTIGATVLLIATGTPVDGVGDRLVALADTTNTTPSVLAFLNVVLILAIPSAMLCTFAFHGLKPRWLASVAPRIRWKWLAVSMGIAVVSLFVALIFGSLLPTSSDGAQISTSPNAFTDTTRDFLLVIVLLTPLQAVAEEYAFRGYLTQAFGGLVANVRVARYLAVLGPALLFAAAHGTQDLPIFVDRLAFGIVSGILVIATGGLEAGIAGHVVNNLLAFGLALSFADMSTALNPTGGSWWDILTTVVKSLVFLSLSVWAARKMGIATRTDPRVLAAPRPRV